MKKILITGKNSYIGNQVELHLSQFDTKYKVNTLDMLDKHWRDHDFSSYDVVFHVAGIAHSDSGKIKPEKARLYYEINSALTVETATIAKAAGVKQFIFMSSIIVYGESAPIGKTKCITIDTKPNPSNAYGDSKLQAELGIQSLASEEFRVSILRPPMIYGKGSKGNYQLLSKLAKRLPLFPKIHNERSILYIENLSLFVKQVIDSESEGVFFPQNSEYASTTELVQLIANANGKRIRTTKFFNPLLLMMSKRLRVLNKAFGNLTYDRSLSAFDGQYNKYSLIDSIERTEQQ